MKKLLVMMLMLFVLLALAACGGDNDTGTQGTAGQDTTPPTTQETPGQQVTQDETPAADTQPELIRDIHKDLLWIELNGVRHYIGDSVSGLAEQLGLNNLDEIIIEPERNHIIYTYHRISGTPGHFLTVTLANITPDYLSANYTFIQRFSVAGLMGLGADGNMITRDIHGYLDVTFPGGFSMTEPTSFEELETALGTDYLNPRLSQHTIFFEYRPDGSTTDIGILDFSISGGYGYIASFGMRSPFGNGMHSNSNFGRYIAANFRENHAELMHVIESVRPSTR